jgi:hypothetical protein
VTLPATRPISFRPHPAATTSNTQQTSVPKTDFIIATLPC